MTLRFEHLPFYKYNRYHQICRYLQDAAGRRSLVFDLSMTHDRFGSSREHFFSPRHHEHKHTHARRVFASSFSTVPLGDRGALHCRWNVIATQPIGFVPFPALGILPRPEEQSRTRGSQSGSVEDQPQCPGLWHSSSPNARSLSRFPSPPPPSFTQQLCIRSCSNKHTHK